MFVRPCCQKICASSNEILEFHMHVKIEQKRKGLCLATTNKGPNIAMLKGFCNC